MCIIVVCKVGFEIILETRFSQHLFVVESDRQIRFQL